MSFKRFLIIVYSLSGLLIASFSAFMTYLIIGEPIGMKMFSKISLTVLLALPVIGIISYWIGTYFFSKFEKIIQRLDAIREGDFQAEESDEKIEELQHIHSSIRHLASRLSKIIEELKNQNRTIANMTASFAHDVKTPLMVIEGYLEEFRDGLIDKETVIQKISQESGYIDDLASDLLDYLGSFQNRREKKQINASEYIQECMELIPLSSDVKWKLDLPRDLPIWFNPMDFKKVCMNLLYNSAKFTSQGEIVVYGSEEALIFQDSGIGIDPMIFDHIFDPFTTADSSRNRRKSGLGIGMSIAKNLAMHNGYDLKIDKSFEKGCRIILQKVS